MSENRNKKSVLRASVLKERARINSDTWKMKSDLIAEKVQNIEEFNRADCIHVYVSMNDRNEVGTDTLLTTILQSDKNLVVPVTNFSKGTLTHSMLTDLSDLKKNKWGVKEPVAIHEIEISNIDLILVPMVAADRSGNRLGYGKGFYDRFLNKSDACKVGMVFNEYLFDEIPTESFDEKLDIIVTDSEVIYL